MRGCFERPTRQAPVKAREHGRVGGFSLIEVTIALGLITFAVVAVLGVLPTGLTSLRRAMDQTVEAQIVQTVGAQAVTGEFASVETGGPLYFDEEGQAIASGDTNTYYYKATLSTTNPVYPQSSLSGTLGNSLKALRIEVTTTFNTNAPVRVYAINVANSGN